jgi:hypothetical protein
MLTGIVFDALETASLEAFWLEATRGGTGGLKLRFVETELPKTQKNRLHLDLAGGPGWQAEVRRLLTLGATRADIGQGEVPWDVLTDPEGNEFCVLRPGHPGVGAEAGLAQICLDVAAEDRLRQLAFWTDAADWRVVREDPHAVRIRRTGTSPVALVMGPPAAPKTGRNRLRLEITDPARESGEFLDPAGNEYQVRG